MSKRKYRKKHINGRTLMLMGLMIAMLCLSVGATYAFLSDKSGIVNNTLEPGVITTEIVEDFNGTVKKNVQIKNTGNVEAYIRAKVVVTWKNSAGEVYGKMPAAGENGDYMISYSEDSNWELADDGFYYWKQPVKSDDEAAGNCSTGVLVSNCTPVEGKAPEGYFLNVEIIASAIQTVPTSTVVEEWSSGVSRVDGTTLIIK